MQPWPLPGPPASRYVTGTLGPWRPSHRAPRWEQAGGSSQHWPPKAFFRTPLVEKEEPPRQKSGSPRFESC